MFWLVNWDGGFVVGGEGNQRLTPSFRLKEFQRAGGAVRVHREVVSALQIVRDRLGKSVSIAGVDDDGLGATVSGQPVPDLVKAARAARSGKLFESIEEKDGKVHVRIPDPSVVPEIDLAQALETAFLVTSAFETAGDKFQQITGNFDGAGLSFGPAQMNFKSGTLQSLFAQFQQADEAALRGCFTDPDDYAEWLTVLHLPTAAKQISWSDTISTGRRNSEVNDPWKGYFQAVGRVEKFRIIMVESTMREYGAKLLNAVGYLQSLRPHVPIDHLRCVCSLWDLVIQQGSLDKAKTAIEARVHREQPTDQFHLVRIGVEERGKTASAEFQNDCVSRRVGVLNGVPETVGDRQRANIQFYLLRDARVRGAADVAKLDVASELARASAAVATGNEVALTRVAG
jgi:hypothetical protein